MGFTKDQIFSLMARTGLVPVFYNPDPETSKAVLKACFDGGVRLFEFADRGPCAKEVFKSLAEFVPENLPDLILGAGTVMDRGAAEFFLDNGAQFIVSPIFNPEVAALCNAKGVPYMPGCGTVTEVWNAQQAGCEICKIFPGDVLGPAFVKGLLAPMPWSKVMVTGGVKPEKENLQAWFKAGAMCVGMGGNLFPKDAMASKDWARITALCRESIDIIAEIKL
ncbi:MAG: bifunctional 4-hydroxy-2-oxoglutarate aldolase/2-dehydro-3-deoxy-phosphogluconate aldolase [Bacteroidales bacterium]|nr:bifunctional 4-hydroxy-2-oxoglutarate aldolase/2-dehydro-3-deoxy-phosphogluconate aldolase [Bacteroidales bacterium]